MWIDDQDEPIDAVLTFPDDRGDLVAKFRQSTVKDRVDRGWVTLTLTGLTKAGIPFQGSETIRVR